MKLKRIQHAGWLLELFVLAVVIWYGRSPRQTLAGALYLSVASYLGLFSLYLPARLRINPATSISEAEEWRLRRWAYILLLSAWQVAIVGLLNIWANASSGSRVSTILGYLAAAVFIVLSYELVGLADSSKQDGGSKPISYFGRPRSRRIFFCAFVYTPIIPLIILSVAWSGTDWCPVVLQPPQIWLVLVALSSAMSAGMVLQRYREASPNQAVIPKLLLLTIGGLKLAGVVQMIFSDKLEVYIFSCVALGFTAATVYWLSLAKQGRSLSLSEGLPSSGNSSASPASSF